MAFAIMNPLIVYLSLALNFIPALGLRVQIVNLCTDMRWPALTGVNINNHSAVAMEMPPGLKPSDHYELSIPEPWAGRVWAKTLCSSQGDECQIGDCGSKNCNGYSSQNTTLVEFNMQNGTVWYDISLGE
jgi:hypothetical protein